MRRVAIPCHRGLQFAARHASTAVAAPTWRRRFVPPHLLRLPAVRVAAFAAHDCSRAACADPQVQHRTGACACCKPCSCILRPVLRVRCAQAWPATAVAPFAARPAFLSPAPSAATPPFCCLPFCKCRTLTASTATVWRCRSWLAGWPPSPQTSCPCCTRRQRSTWKPAAWRATATPRCCVSGRGARAGGAAPMRARIQGGPWAEQLPRAAALCGLAFRPAAGGCKGTNLQLFGCSTAALLAACYPCCWLVGRRNAVSVPPWLPLQTTGQWRSQI